jgi:hypothetical protein
MSDISEKLKNISPEEFRCYDTINRGRKRIEELKKEESDIYNDTRVAQDLLTLLLRDKYESLGFKKGVKVKYNNKQHKIDTIFFDSEMLMMQVILTPAPSTKLFGKIFVDDLKIIK